MGCHQERLCGAMFGCWRTQPTVSGVEQSIYGVVIQITPDSRAACCNPQPPSCQPAVHDAVLCAVLHASFWHPACPLLLCRRVVLMISPVAVTEVGLSCDQGTVRFAMLQSGPASAASSGFVLFLSLFASCFSFFTPPPHSPASVRQECETVRHVFCLGCERGPSCAASAHTGYATVCARRPLCLF